MALGAFLLVIFILHLIDKHDKWRQAVKVVVGLIVLYLLGAGGIYGWSKYGDYKAAKQQAAEAAAQRAEKVVSEKRIQDCVNRYTTAANDPSDPLSKIGVPEVPSTVQVECDQDPDTQPPCWSKPDKTGNQFDLNNMYDLNGKRLPPAPNTGCVPLTKRPSFNPKAPYRNVPKGFRIESPVEKHVKAKLRTDIVTTEYGDLTCGHVEEGEVVTLLEDTGDRVKVKNDKGQVGW